MSKVNKEELLLQSFEILKADLEGNSSKIKDIIVKISKKNTPLAIDMWKYVLKNSKSYLKQGGYSFAGGLVYGLEGKIGRGKALEILIENEDILEYIFGKVAEVPDTVLWDLLKTGNRELAGRLHELIKSNRFKENSLADIIDTLCVYFDDEFGDLKDQDEDEDDDYYDEDYEKEANLATEIANILLEWGSELKDKEAKARITVTLIDYI